MSNAKLEKIPIWQAVTEIADYSDGLLAELPEVEKWGIESKLRSRTLDVTTDVAEAFGAIDPRDKKWLLGSARRSLFGLKNMLKVTQKRRYAEIDPSIMVAIDKVIDVIDKEIMQTTKDIPVWFKEMSPPASKDKER